ncbi:MAG: CehA/McbA family metallohydrolase [Paenibacillus sp.]|uniref:CehA/McbA family metallohydrolase n=1 Tax=Paenibacillus sp. TaxID=58172 RepID=UPI0028FFA881|nr:CehA/McbA family metallohydrolase [Paenibacillus sp.]MDU2242928.1 CehA/McbA family metallohydrolase [Paenibacillus sp.]
MANNRLERQVHVRLGHEQERSYPEVAFSVPEGAESIEVRYHYEKNDRSVVDLGLRSPDRIIGWSGGARDGFQIGLEKATPGYLAGPIHAGEWAVLLGAYRVPAEGILVELHITINLKHPHWIKGDLHAHTVHSDGKYTISEALDSCRMKGLDFLALTDHNTSSQNLFTGAKDETLLLIPGVELTSYKGHANLLGHPDALTDFRVLTTEAAANELSQAREKGALVSLNHPFCPDCPWELGFDVPFDAIEVWNGPWRGLNETAVAWWQQRLAEGRRIVAVGGSDTHREDPLVRHGGPTAHVYVAQETVAAVLEAVRRGAVVLSMGPEDTFITLEADEAGVGEELKVAGRDDIELTMTILGAQGDRVGLWSDRGLEREWTMEEGERELVCRMPADRLFYRVEARRYLPEWDVEVMTCLTNPVYIAQAVLPARH